MFGRNKADRQQQECPAAPEQRGPRIRTFYANVTNGVVPCAKGSEFVQLPPIVAPVSFVPYMTQEQPLLMMDDEDY